MVGRWYAYLQDATGRGGKRIDLPPTVELLRQQGFVDVQEEVVRLPFNEWPAEERQKTIGRWYSLALTESIEALSLAPLARVYKWPVADIRRLVEDVRKQILDKTNCTYNTLYVALILWQSQACLY